MASNDQNSPEAVYDQGRKRLADGQVDRACEAFCRLLEICSEALDDVAATFGSDRQRQQAVAFAHPGEPSSPATAARCAFAARLTRDLGRPRDALPWARRATQIEPRCATWWFELGETCRATGDPTAAAIAYKRCLSYDPNHSEARLRLSVCRRGGWPARALARSRLVHRLLQRVAWTGKRAALVEDKGDCVGAHQMRWAGALERGGALPIFWKTPEGEEPENFGEHMKDCQCPFWRWFLAQGIDREIHTVLDVGCGTGSMTEHFLRHGYDVSGVTCNPDEKAECLKRGIRIVEEDFHFLSTADGSFDLVFSSHSLEHSVSPVFALMEWKRVVRPGGYMMIDLPLGIERDARVVFPDYYDPQVDAIRFPLTGGDIFARQESYYSVCTYGGGLHVYVLTYWQLRWLFERLGLELVADGLELPGATPLYGAEHVDGRLPRDDARPFSGLFLLRKPAPAGTQGPPATAGQTRTGGAQ